MVLLFWPLMNLYNDSIFQTIIIMMISWVIIVERKEVPSSALRIEMASLDEHGWKRNINLRWWTYTTKTKVLLHMFFLVLYPAFSVKTWMPFYDKSAGEIILNWILDIYYMTVLLVFLERERVKKSQYVSKKTVKMQVKRQLVLMVIHRSIWNSKSFLYQLLCKPMRHKTFLSDFFFSFSDDKSINAGVPVYLLADRSVSIRPHHI